LELAVTRLQLNETERVETRLLQFHVFDGGCRLVIEAYTQDEALCLCREMGWEFICACD